MPPGCEADIVRGLYRLSGDDRPQARLLGSGAILREVQAAAQLLRQDWDLGSEVYSVTSFSELAREAAEVERWNRLHPRAPPRRSHIAQRIGDEGPVIAATDYVRAYPQLIAPYVSGRFVALGTDGFGRSDNRPELRRFFEVDRLSIVVATLSTLVQLKRLPAERAAQAIERYGVNAEQGAPWRR
jgi:pyruvate dehydrogenase E1 component